MDYHANVVVRETKKAVVHPEGEKMQKENFLCVVMNVTHKDAEKIIAMSEERNLQPDYWIKRKDGYDTLQWDCINQKEKEKISQFYRDKN